MKYALFTNSHSDYLGIARRTFSTGTLISGLATLLALFLQEKGIAFHYIEDFADLLGGNRTVFGFDRMQNRCLCSISLTWSDADET
jgi:hypothetical protein